MHVIALYISIQNYSRVDEYLLKTLAGSNVWIITVEIEFSG